MRPGDVFAGKPLIIVREPNPAGAFGLCRRAAAAVPGTLRNSPKRTISTRRLLSRRRSHSSAYGPPSPVHDDRATTAMAPPSGMDASTVSPNSRAEKITPNTGTSVM